MNSLLEFTHHSIIEVYESSDFEFDAPVEEEFSAGEVIDVYILSEDVHNYQVQFGDGSVGIIPVSFVKKV